MLFNCYLTVIYLTARKVFRASKHLLSSYDPLLFETLKKIARKASVQCALQ